MVAQTILQDPVKDVKADPTWISVIYIERQLETDIDDAAMSGTRVPFRPPLLRNFQWVNIPSDHKAGQAIESGSFYLHSGANVGLLERLPDDRQLITRFDVTLFKKVFSQPLNQWLLYPNDPFFPDVENEQRRSFIRVLIPVKPDDIGEPAYRHFSLSDAKLLVNAHLHASWINRALVGENRPEIQNLAQQRIAKLIEIERQKQLGE